MSQLLAFTKNLRTIFKKEQIKKFVLGNSSADYDSIFGSLIYAFYLTTYFKTTYLPLIDCPKADIKLRFEVSQIQNQLGINYEDLLYTQDVVDLYKGNHTFFLYDHNFRKQLASEGVFEIVDHHAFKEEEVYAPHFIHTIGSGLTLLYYLLNPQFLTTFKDNVLLQKFLKIRKTVDKPFEEYDPIIDKIIYYGVLLDSFGFNINLKQRWTEYDVFAVQNIKSSQQELGHTYENLENMKNSIQLGLKLELRDHLRKDYKEMNYSGINAQYSVIYLPTNLFVDKYWNQVEKHFSEIPNTKQSAYFLMFAYKNEKQEIERQMIFRSGNEEFIQIVIKVMNEMKSVRLDDISEWQRWIDPSAVLSRKLFDKKVRTSWPKL